MKVWDPVAFNYPHFLAFTPYVLPLQIVLKLVCLTSGWYGTSGMSYKKLSVFLSVFSLGSSILEKFTLRVALWKDSVVRS